MTSMAPAKANILYKGVEVLTLCRLCRENVHIYAETSVVCSFYQLMERSGNLSGKGPVSLTYLCESHGPQKGFFQGFTMKQEFEFGSI